MIDRSVTLEATLFERGGLTMRFDTQFTSGEITAIIGPSGAGKSTLLDLVAGFETPSSGRIRVGGDDVSAVSPVDRPVSMVFQENNLFSHLTVETNIGLGIRPDIAPRPEDGSVIANALQKVDLGGYEQRLPGSLSGGERQRVAIARALVRRKPVLLLDEPFAALGPRLRRDMLDLIRELQAETGMTTAIVTHQPDEAAEIAATVVFIDAGETVASGPAGTFLNRTDVPGLADYLVQPAGARGGLPGSPEIG